MTAVLRLHSYWYQVGITQPQTGHGLRSDPEEQGFVWNANRPGWLEADITLIPGDTKSEQSRVPECESEGVRAGAGV